MRVRGGRSRRKRSGLLLIVALSHYRSKAFFLWQLTGGKTNQEFEILNREGERRKDRVCHR